MQKVYQPDFGAEAMRASNRLEAGQASAMLNRQGFIKGGLAAASFIVSQLTLNTPIALMLTGRKLFIPEKTTTPGFVGTIYFNGTDGVPFRPGMTFNVDFENPVFVITAMPAAGTLNFIAAKYDMFSVEERPIGFDQGNIVDSATVAVTSASTSNTPSAATDGVSLEGVTGWRGIVYATTAGQTLTSLTGNVFFWLYDTVLGAWVRSNSLGNVGGGEAVNSQVAARGFVTQDYQVLVPSGRVFIEPNAVAASSGTVSWKVQTWGNR